MKFSLAVLVTAAASASATSPLPIFGKMKQGKTKSLTGEVTADSSLGSKLLSKARRLDEDEEIDYTWVSGMSLKFQGCFHVSQWNAEADGEEDVKIATKRLARFRLCPTDYCSSDYAGGCESGYGDYIIDMPTYLQSYLEAKREYEEGVCEYLQENTCVCEDNGDDAWDEDTCLNDCYSANGADYCVEVEGEEKFEPNEYVECGQFDIPDDDGNRRLEEDEEEQYFIGPYCGNQGGDIYLGMFSEETCSEFVDSNGGSSTYKSFVGESLPYSSQSLIGSECVSCLAENDADDDGQEDETNEMCEMMYQSAGKCESGLSIDYPNENACTFMEGIKIIRKSGVVSTEAPAPSKAASAFIGIFAVSFCLLGAYVYYLKTKLDKAKINLADS
mmetsp:Transcript_28167/g.34291  ORF Transcript_28167/g.34291 Transcript_28167/m.34291 type:complete len:388 (-) Transcript_28167:417-1580(-)|eukprot:CAMPEP_0172518486 /NCGR_PEP_ID=MMETSP1066-20121228/290854_1 /TAXON_ID=671091 /ORGANISM="Coscinodiscus wailesii, Strain CCMP2513" /LENGTH=387 /DNA_ID=CAMNT_0013300895 /DNA_START=94 /DNA_END=1257 /DNA_ORIENTATION=+